MPAVTRARCEGGVFGWRVVVSVRGSASSGRASVAWILASNLPAVAVFPIRTYPDPVLRLPANPVADPTPELRRLVAGMGDIEAIKALTEMMRVHKTNAALLASLR